MDYNFLSKTVLFRGVTPEEAREMLQCLGAEERHYCKGETILRAGEPTRVMGLVLSGRAQMEIDDLWGNRSILGSAAPGFVFGETYACIPGDPLMINVVAAEHSDILLLQISRVLKTCPTACAHHSRLVRNLLTLSAEKNLALSRRIQHTTPKSIRGRLLSYLSFQAAHSGGLEFNIPFDRQQLADYLGVDRSAMSAELSKMQREGLLQTQRSHFILSADSAGFYEP